MKGDKTCTRCGESPMRTAATLCGFCIRELEHKALLALKSNRPPYGTYGIWHLRERGYTPEQITRAQNELAEGVSVEIVHRRLRVEDDAAVAA